VRCTSCGTENEAGTRFCDACGSALATGCPSCGASNRPQARFCATCGTALGASPAPAATTPGPTGGSAAERRLVSVLFADLVGFTPFAEGRDAEDVRETLGRYFELASGIIGRYGGTVEKFIGDAVMAVWGAPVAREDDAERSVRAALELVAAVGALGQGIEARAGVLTGEAAVSIGATNQGMVAGDLVNTAARLQSVAPPGAVLVGEATHRAASAAIAFEPAGEQVLKGKASPVPSWRAVRVVAGARGRNRSETLEAPFVGRDEELRLLKELYHATEREQRARLVSVIGPAGIGKSRLAWEFLKYADGLVDDVWWHQGRSPAYGEGISFWALGEMIRGRAGLLETDDETTTRAKVGAVVETHVPDEAEGRWIEGALLSLLGYGTGQGSEQLFAAWRTFFERLAASAPVALVFEDFHFADAGLLDFVDHLMDWSRNVPIYVLTLSRPELLDRRPAWGSTGRSFASVHLDPLPEPAMRQLLGGLVPGLPEAAVRTIVARADGVPLYAVETVRMLVTDGHLEQRDGAYVPVGELGSLAIPETLTALIASRLDALEPGERALIADAAVLGQSFTPAALSAVAGVPEEELAPRLRTLVRRELFTLDVDPRSPERGQYAFVQALIREVAYNTLSKHDRRVRHLAAARFFESLGTDELAGALAGHYLAAHATAAPGPEADALGAQARIALEGAATRASTLGSHDQAVVYLEEALGVAKGGPERALLLERAGVSARSGGHIVQSQAFLQEAIELHRHAGDRVGAARAIALLGWTLTLGRHLQASLELLRPAAEEFADLFPEPGVVSLWNQLARAQFLGGEHRPALERLEPVLEAAEHAGQIDVLADGLVTKGSLLCGFGRLHEGIAVIEAGERLALEHGYGATQLRGLNNRISYFEDIDPRAAHELAVTGLELAGRLGERPVMYGFLQAIAFDELLMNADTDAPIALLEPVLEEDSDTGDRIQLVTALILARGARGDDVTPLLEQIDRSSAGVTDPRAGAEFARAFVDLFAGRYREAADEFGRVTQADDFAFAHQWSARVALLARDVAAAERKAAALEALPFLPPVQELRLTTMRAGIAAARGDTETALRLFRVAIGGWKDFGLLWEVAWVGFDMAVSLDPSLAEVRAATGRARELFERMNASAVLRLLDAELTRGGGPSTARRTPSSIIAGSA
jgi:class 3 adenylate cyclase/tetratricopeptide (TPR) repeat protein